MNSFSDDGGAFIGQHGAEKKDRLGWSEKGADFEGFREGGDTEKGGMGGECLGGLEEAVAVSIGLDDGHDVASSDLAGDLRIVRDRGEINFGPAAVRIHEWGKDRVCLAGFLPE